MIYNLLRKRNVKLEELGVTYKDIDKFMAMTSSGEKRQWQVFELTQSENVAEWIRIPEKISNIQPNLKNLSMHIRKLPKPVKILDVGCYGGYLYDYLRQFSFKNYSEFSYFGIDIDKPSIMAAKYLHKKYKNAHFKVGDIYSITQDFKPEEFDVVCCYRVIIHIPFFEEAVKNLCFAASKFVHIALLIEDKESCRKIRETDLDTDKKAIYFIRAVTKGMIEESANKLDLDYQITTDYNRFWLLKYLPILGHKNKKDPYATLIFRKKLK